MSVRVGVRIGVRIRASLREPHDMTLLGLRQHGPVEHETLQHVDRLAPRATPLHVAKRLRRRSHTPSVVVVATAAAAIAATTVATTTGVITVRRYARG